MDVNAASQTASQPGTAWAATFKNIWQGVRSSIRPRTVRRLRVCETLSLGDRRFLAVVEFNQQEFLVGGTGSSLALLARLDGGSVAADSSLPGGGLPGEGR